MSETNQGWKWDLFDPYLPPSILKEIQSHELREDFTISDILDWKYRDKGKFSIKSTTRIMKNHSDSLDEEL